MDDFKEWWNKEEIFTGEGAMEAAEASWDCQQRKIDGLKQQLEHAYGCCDFRLKNFRELQKENEALKRESRQMREALISFKKQYSLSTWIHKTVDEVLPED